MASSLPLVILFFLVLLFLARPLCRWIRSLFSKQTGLAAARWTRRLVGLRARRPEHGACALLEKLHAVPCGQAAAEEQTECAVCLCAVEEGDEIRELRCRHVFHRPCLDEWVDHGKETCPLCRVPLFSPAGEIDDEAIPEDVALPFSALLHSSLLRW